jgi:hypothetical protein
MQSLRVGMMDIYKIEQPPISSADGVQWEEIKLSPDHAAPLLEAKIISKKVKLEVSPAVKK